MLIALDIAIILKVNRKSQMPTFFQVSSTPWVDQCVVLVTFLPWILIISWKVFLFLWVLEEVLLDHRSDFQGHRKKTASSLEPGTLTGGQMGTPLISWNYFKPSKLIPIWKFLDVLNTQTTMGWWKEKVTSYFHGITLMGFSLDITMSKLKFKNLMRSP